MKTLIQAARANKLWQRGYLNIAEAVPLHWLVNASKFERAQVAAASLKEQRSLLWNARSLLKCGRCDEAKLMLTSWQNERKAYNLLFTFGIK